ncbi:MAG: alpha/beta fold hydrolase [Planctomycetaceae bacterium]|nr:alpha/beta fold hydrolase [Planctomycetaceae bacterium]
MQTMGGRLFWGDVYFFHEWKIQQNVFTGHYRLLNGKDVRKASGTYGECLDALLEIRKEQNLEPMTGKAVILVHGIIRSSRSFDKLKKRLVKEGYQVFGFNYPSTRVPITDASRYLERVLTSFDGIEQIDFVVHSMGGLVVRCYLKNCEQVDPRIRRMVMLGVPNQGAGIADKVKSWPVYKLLYGPAGQQLVTDSEGLIPQLPVPEFEFGIIAGARGTEKGFNPLIPGDDDGTVELEHTKLPGAADFMKVSALHSFLMGHPAVIDATVRFLEEGKFRANEPAQPLPAEQKENSEATVSE